MILKNNVLIAGMCWVIVIVALPGKEANAQGVASPSGEPAVTAKTESEIAAAKKEPEGRPEKLEKPGQGVPDAATAVRLRRAEQKDYRGRDPFWPVGYFPRAKEVAVTQQGESDWEAAEKSLRVTAVVENFAVVCSRVVTAGDGITLRHGKFIYAWTVRSVSKEDGLKLDRTRVRPIGK